ncbi:glycosyltransferase family 2 protein [Paraclostridium sordellii]|uniref:glycosyltransferase family 2 protein n=1 Tax=Paraclostridium sordellii TaxID=1505 RepID=UPI00096A7DED|nr:glycosyltransferase [Paeniclostridium sordellii]
MKKVHNNLLVSIIMPTFNSGKYIEKSIESVIYQSYREWELIIVDDNSSDNTEEIVNRYRLIDNRIKYLKFNSNKGAAVARNTAIDIAKGRFLAFLDSDDLWNKEKLDIQVKFMIANNTGFSFTDYELIDDEGISLDKIVKMPQKLSYEEYLRNTIIQTVTVMIDRNYVNEVKMPLIRRRQDFACWLNILKTGVVAVSIPKVLAKYRRANNSLSSNKVKAIKGTWYVYREIEKLSFIKTIRVFIGYAINACKKRIYMKKYIKKCIKKLNQECN